MSVRVPSPISLMVSAILVFRPQLSSLRLLNTQRDESRVRRELPCDVVPQHALAVPPSLCHRSNFPPVCLSSPQMGKRSRFKWGRQQQDVSGGLAVGPVCTRGSSKGGLTLHTRSRTSTEVPQETILNVTQRILQQGSISLVTLRLTEGEKCLGRLEPDVTWAVGATFTADCHY